MTEEKKEQTTTETEKPKKAKGKGGRKPRAPQTLPLILSQARNRVTKEVPMDGETYNLIESYGAWAANKGGLTKDEAIVLLLEKAVSSFIKKDTLFNTETAKKPKTKGAHAPVEKEV